MQEDNFKEKIIEILKDHGIKYDEATDDWWFTNKELSSLQSWGKLGEIPNEITKATDQEIGKRLKELGVGITNCKKCGKEIVFLKTKAGNLMPACLNLKSHFIDCPGAKEFRKGHIIN